MQKAEGIWPYLLTLNRSCSLWSKERTTPLNAMFAMKPREVEARSNCQSECVGT